MRTAALLLLAACAASTQSDAGRPSFEAASLRPVKPGRGGSGPLRGGPGTASPGQLSGAATLRALLMRANGLKDYQIAGPAWMDTDRYEIAAKIPAGAGEAQVSLMLQSLIAERFHLASRRETRMLPVYMMVAAKNGPKLKESAPPGDGDAAPFAAPRLAKGADGLPDLPPGTTLGRSYEVVLAGSDGIVYKLWARGEAMPQLADRLSAVLNRPVIDRTRLEGRYDFTLAWSIESAGGFVARKGPPPDEIESSSAPVLSDPGLSIFTALPAQLGLRLESGRAPIQMLIVTAAERNPARN